MEPFDPLPKLDPDPNDDPLFELLPNADPLFDPPPNADPEFDPPIPELIPEAEPNPPLPVLIPPPPNKLTCAFICSIRGSYKNSHV